MRLRKWGGVTLPLCMALALGSACEEEDDDEAGDSGAEQRDASAADAAANAHDATTGPVASDASVGGVDARAAAADAATLSVSLDAQGFPILPAASANILFLTVTNSRSSRLADGNYQAPYSTNASSGSTVTFLHSGFVLATTVTLQVQLNLKQQMMSGSFTCNGSSGMVVRYGMPPSGNNQLLPKSCSVEYTYDAANLSYTGTIRAVLADGLEGPSETATADVAARFTFVPRK